MVTSAPSFITVWQALAIACKPEEQKRFIVAPAVSDEQPAQSAAFRATLWPVAPSGCAVPR